MVLTPRTEPAALGPSQVSMVGVGVRLICIRMYIFHIPLRNVLPVNVNDATIIRNRMSPRVWLMFQQNGK